MKIENLGSGLKDGKSRVSATVVWEDCDCPTKEYYIETNEEHGQSLTPDPHAFLVACIIPALRHGEQRILIEEPICPELASGVMTAMRIISQWCPWYVPDPNLVRVEAKKNRPGGSITRSARAGVFLSGGIDSLSTLRANRLNFSSDDAAYFKDAFFVHGLQPEIDRVFEQALSSVSRVAYDTGLELIPISTNFRYLEDDWRFWEHAFEAALFSSLAHAFADRVTSVTIAPTYDLNTLRPLGSHPLLDPNYSSSNLRIRHGDVTLSRFLRTKLVAEWDVGLENIRVCNRPEQPNMLNCGKCEKCIRTMLGLVALGVLDKTSAFPVNDVSGELVGSACRHLNETTFLLYSELLVPLRQKGRYDLARDIEHGVANYHKRKTKQRIRQQTVGRIKDIDSKYLNGNLQRLNRAVHGLTGMK